MDRSIDLIRHGEPVGGRKYRGQLDDPLSDKGWLQMWSAVGDYRGWQQIVTSPLCRCSDFAKALGGRYAIPIEQDDRLKEIGFGEWEGYSAQQLREKDPACIQRFLADPIAHQPNGAEPLAAFYQRVVAAWQQLEQKYAQKNLLVVAHAGVIRAVITYVLGAPLESMYRLSVSNAAITRIVFAPQRPPSLLFHDGVLR